MIAQDPTKHPGSIIRINIDGSIQKILNHLIGLVGNNPKFDVKVARNLSNNIRNPQGLTLSPFDKKIYMI